MDVEVIHYSETPDGGAYVTLELSQEALSAVIQQGFTKIMKDYIDEIDSAECDTTLDNSECGERD